MSDEEFSGRTALVTGGSRGIGAAIAAALAARGANVIVSGRDERALADVVARIRLAHGQAEMVAADVTDDASVQQLRHTATATFGTVELLVACAGGGGDPTPLVDMDIARWRRTVDVNLTSAFLTLKRFLPPMYERGRGAVVTMASSAGRQLSGASSAYAAAKAGLLSLTRQAAIDAAAHGVRVNAIAPSAVVTDRLAAQPPAVLAQIAQGFPLRRIGTVEDVAHAALFLLSDASSWLTGITLDVAGGRVMMCEVNTPTMRARSEWRRGRSRS
jgi:3-oxoacyl-[acyl-carrier protein] reductase